ncbi:MAG: TetR/AcrR family transcriptional regulator [Syntrophales bacterium]|nr:TetR/AcrR family transcriptional regulator [Syntrophales bacterium]
MGREERRKRERENRRNLILKSARRLFFEKGFRSVTVESIAKKAELSKGSVYLYFKSKEEIYTQILLEHVEKFHKAVAGLLKEGGDSADNLKKYADVYVDFFLRERELFRILMNYMLHTDHTNLPTELDTQLIKATNKTVDVIDAILQKGIKTGEFKPDLDIRQKRNALWGLLNGVISLYLFTGEESKREERIRSTIRAGLDLFLRGLAESAERFPDAEELSKGPHNAQTKTKDS